MSTNDNTIRIKVKQDGRNPSHYDTITLHMERRNIWGVTQRFQFSVTRGELRSALKAASIEAPLLALTTTKEN